MRQRWRWAIALLAFGLGVLVAYLSAGDRGLSLAGMEETQPTVSSVAETIAPSPTLEAPMYEQRVLEFSTVHILKIPGNSSWEVRPLVADSLKILNEFATDSGAIAVINGGYFDPVNQQTTSFISQNGAIIADPQDNDRLMDNPDLTPYLPKILNRSEFRRYQCGGEITYAIARHNDSIPEDCQLADALGAGPRLLPHLTAEDEGFVEVVDGVVVRDAIGTTTPNARSAIGITEHGDLVWLMVAQRPDLDSPTGMTLAEVSDMLRSLNVTDALNLDGGSSSSLWHNGTRYYGKLNDAQEWIDRSVKSALILDVSTP